MRKKWFYKFEEQKAEQGMFGVTQEWSGYVVYTEAGVFFDGYDTEAEALKIVNYQNGEE